MKTKGCRSTLRVETEEISGVMRTKNKATGWLRECKCSSEVRLTSGAGGRQFHVPVPRGSYLPPCKTSKTRRGGWRRGCGCSAWTKRWFSAATSCRRRKPQLSVGAAPCSSQGLGTPVTITWGCEVSLSCQGTCSKNCARVLSSASGQTLRLSVDLHRYSVSRRRCHAARKHDF